MSNTTTHIVDLGTDPSIRTAADLRDRLITAVAQHGSIVISGEAAHGVDISILQLLASAHRSARAGGKSISLKADAAGAFQQTLQRAGFVGADGAPLAAEGEFWTHPTHAAKDEAA